MIDLRTKHTITNLQKDNDNLKLEIKNKEKEMRIKLFKEDREKRIRAAKFLNKNRKSLNISSEDIRLFLHVSQYDLNN